MAKDKSLGVNPALAHHKKMKRDGINKAKAEKSKTRDMHLKKRRPDQMQKQIDDLQALQNSGKINGSDKKLLQTLQKDLARLNRLNNNDVTPVIVSDNSAQRNAEAEKKRLQIPKNPKKSFYYDPICTLLLGFHLTCRQPLWRSPTRYALQRARVKRRE